VRKHKIEYSSFKLGSHPEQKILFIYPMDRSAKQNFLLLKYRAPISSKIHLFCGNSLLANFQVSISSGNDMRGLSRLEVRTRLWVRGPVALLRAPKQNFLSTT